MKRTRLAVDLAVFLLFGVVVPWYKGLDFLDLELLLPFSLLGVLFVAPPAVAIAAAQRPRADGPFFLRALSRAVIGGWLRGVLLLAAGLAVVRYKVGRAVLPAVPVLLCLLLLGILGALLMGALAAAAGFFMRPERTALMAVRVGFLGLLCLIIGLPRVLPDETVIDFLGVLTPEGLVRLTLFAAPVVAAVDAAVLAAIARRSAG